MKSFFALFIILPLMALTSVAQTAAPLRILAIGDSNGTFPYSWPLQLKNLIPNAEVYNNSRSGRTVGFVNNGDSTLNELLTLDRDLKKAADFAGSRPFDYIVIALGTNDAKAVFAPRQNEVAANLETLITRIRNSTYSSVNKAKILIIAPPPYGAKTESQEKYVGGRQRVEKMKATFKTVAEKNGCLFADAFTLMEPFIDTMTADGLHMNAEAQGKFAGLVAGAITGKQ
jgi:lysophospholipase L1-like esterase